MSKWLVFAIILLIAVPGVAQDSGGAASDVYAEAVARLRKSPGDQRAFEDARSAGFDAVGRGLYGRALVVFEAALEVRPADGITLYGKALSLFNLRRVDEALVSADAAVGTAEGENSKGNGSRSGVANALTLRAVILAVQGRTAESIRDLRTAVQFDPDNFDAQFSLGRACYGIRDVESAAKAFAEAVRLRPEDVNARFFLATSLERSGDLDGALKAYRELIRLAPGRPEGHLGAGALLVKRGAADEAEGIVALERAVELNGELYEARIALGRTLVRQGRTLEAIDHLQQAARLAPGNPEAHYQLALALRKLGKRAESAAEFREVQRINEDRRKKGRVNGADPR